MGHSTGILPKGVSRSRLLSREKFSFDHAFTHIRDAETHADRKRDRGYKARVIHIGGGKGKYSGGIFYKYAVYVRRR